MSNSHRKNECYFAAANTKDGFLSYFDDIFCTDCCDRVYILKGGPGVGKSTFMKVLGKISEEKGYFCEYFYCSSDPDSLDGIIIKDKRTAVIDGTSPHTAEPKIPGAREIIIDLGTSWDTERLYQNSDKIRELIQCKNACYKECYSFLYSKNAIDNLIYNLVYPYIYFDKLEKSTKRLFNSLFKGKKPKSNAKTNIRITSAASTKGKIRLSTFEDMAAFCIFIKQPFENSRIPSLYLQSLYDHAKTFGTDIFVSYNVQNPALIDALYFPDTNVSISVYDELFVSNCDRALKKCKIINGARFVDLKAFSYLKILRKFYGKVSQNIEKHALDTLAKAGEYHARLEEIYKEFTDYSVVDKISKDYYSKIL